jgi:beta-1,4-mannosyltransferase
VPEPGRSLPSPHVLIPHGNYRQPFGTLPREFPQRGRILFFGIIRPYKGLERLLAVFQSMDDDMELQIVGAPDNAALCEKVRAAAHDDPRISSRFEFLPDAILVRHVTAASLVVLPYLEMHSSGAVLAALSLDRRVLIPDSPTGRALEAEVGPSWVHLYQPPLAADHIRAALASPPADVGPDLSARDWSAVRRSHGVAYSQVVRRSSGVSDRATT